MEDVRGEDRTEPTWREVNEKFSDLGSRLGVHFTGGEDEESGEVKDAWGEFKTAARHLGSALSNTVRDPQVRAGAGEALGSLAGATGSTVKTAAKTTAKTTAEGARKTAEATRKIVQRVGGGAAEQPIVSCEWLASNLTNRAVRIVDARWYLADPEQGGREYAQAHLPGAVFLDVEKHLSAVEGPGRHPLPDRNEFAALLGERGIGPRNHVVVYDQGGGAIAARLWWMLRSLGHGRVSVLDGGLARWTASGFLTTGVTPVPEPVAYEPASDPTSVIDRDELLSRLGAVQVIDAREAERYRGEEETVDPVPGHIPTALSAPYAGNLTEEGTFKSPEDLAARFAALGLDPERPIVSSCGSGVTACHNILALHMAGYPEPMLYPGSWSDWSASSLPAATGPEPGSPASGPPGI